MASIYASLSVLCLGGQKSAPIENSVIRLVEILQIGRPRPPRAARKPRPGRISRPPRPVKPARQIPPASGWFILSFMEWFGEDDDEYWTMNRSYFEALIPLN